MNAAAPNQPSPATVIIVEDEDAVREALMTLTRAAGYQSIEFASGEAFLAWTLPTQPCCLLLDQHLGGQSGLEVLQELNRRGNTPPVLFLTGDDSVTSAVDSMKFGAMDYLQKPFDPEQLLERVDAAVQVSADEYAQNLLAARDHALLGQLTKREHEVLALLAAGRHNKEIARQLGISTRTVESHRMHIMHKLQVNTVADLTRLWLRWQDSGPQ